MIKVYELSKPIRTFPNIFKPIQTYQNLTTPIQTLTNHITIHPNFSKPIQPYSSLSKSNQNPHPNLRKILTLLNAAEIGNQIGFADCRS